MALAHIFVAFGRAHEILMPGVLKLIPGNGMLHGMNEYGTEMYGSAFPGTSTKFYISKHSNERPFSMTFGSVTIHLTDIQARTFYLILRDEFCKRDATAAAEYELQAGLRDAYAVRDVDEDYEAAFADLGGTA